MIFRLHLHAASFFIPTVCQQPEKEKLTSEKYVPEGTSANVLKTNLWINHVGQL